MIKMISISDFDNFDKSFNSADSGDQPESGEFSALLTALSAPPLELKPPEQGEKFAALEERDSSENTNQIVAFDNSAGITVTNNNATSIQSAATKKEILLLNSETEAPQPLKQISSGESESTLKETDDFFARDMKNSILSESGEVISDSPQVLEIKLQTAPKINFKNLQTVSAIKYFPALIREISIDLRGKSKIQLTPQKTDEVSGTNLPPKPQLFLSPEIRIKKIINSASAPLASIIGEVSDFPVKQDHKAEDSLNSQESDFLSDYTVAQSEDSSIKLTTQLPTNSANSDFVQTESGKTKSNGKITENQASELFESFVSNASDNSSVKNEAATNANREKVFAQLVAHLEPELFVFAGKTEKTNILKLRLRPAELGAVEINLEKSDSGKIRAHFHTETEAARQILVERLDELRDALQKSGLQIEKLDVSCEAFSPAGSNENRDNQSRQTETLKTTSRNRAILKMFRKKKTIQI